VHDKLTRLIQGIAFSSGPEAAEQRRFGVQVLLKLGMGTDTMEKYILNDLKKLIRYLEYALF